jgi:hypothetical protein
MRVVRNKSRSPKAPKNIFLGESPAEGGLECEKQLGLGDVRNPGLDEERDFGTIHCLQDAVTADIERRGKVRGMGRKTECYDVVFLAIVVKFGVDVALMAIQH